MTAFILRRLGTLVPMLLAVTLLVFALMSLAPGDFLTPVKAQRDINPALIAELQKSFGLDRPWYEQYLRWLGNILRLDFGYSWTYKVPVAELIAQRAPATILLSLCSLALAWGLAIPLAVLAAARPGGWIDKLTSSAAYFALAIPEFFLALLAVWFAAQTGWFPIGGLTSLDHDFLPFGSQLLDIAWHLILPTLVLGLGGVAGTLRVLRANVLDVLRAEYVTAARAKGLPEKDVLRNALNPLLSTIGYAFAGLLSGSLLVENVMNYPGLGRLVYEAFIREDQFVVLGSVMVGCTLLVIGNLISDLALAWSDPRVRYGR
jgi:peptide/nickel transport system permease protein